MSKPAPGTTRRILNSDWPEVGARKGFVVVARFGPVRVGQLVSIVYRGSVVISRLVARDGARAITISGRTGKPRTLQPSEYKIEGPVIEIRPRTFAERLEAREEKRRESKTGRPAQGRGRREPVDFLLWKQSHVRPVKTCDVRAE